MLVKTATCSFIMSSYFDKLCTSADFCYNLASYSVPYVKTVANYIPFGDVVVKAQTAYFERPLLLRELSMVRHSLDQFKANIEDIEKMQSNSGVSICSLRLGKETIKEFETLLEWYNVDDLQTKVTTLSDPGWYRLQLQYMVAMMNNTTSQIQLEAQTALMHAYQVRNMPPGKERDAALQELQRKTCPMAGNAPAA